MHRLFFRLLFLLLFSYGSTYGQWEEIPFGSGQFWNEVFFVDNDHGWITGQTPLVLRTIDGGVTWLTTNLPGATFSANRDICFLNPTTGFVSGEDGVWKTNDGGMTWTAIPPPAQLGQTLGGVWFIDANVGICAFGNCDQTLVTFCRTVDGGRTWTVVQYTNPVDVSVGGITHMNGVWYASGGLGKFWTSTDNGITWRLSNTGAQGWQEDLISRYGRLHIASANGGSCAAAFGGRLLRSVDGGGTWSSTLFPTLMWGISMFSPTGGWACGDGGRAYRTTDGGVTWNESSCGLDPNDRLDDLWFSDSTHGWAVGDGIYRYTVLSIVADGGGILCAGDSLRLSVKGRGSIRWSPSEGLSCTDCASPVATPTRTTTYRVDIFGIVGCEGTDSVTVTVHPKPVTAAEGGTTICRGDTVGLIASGGLRYSWFPAGSLTCSDCPTPGAYPDTTTVYTVVAYDSNGCFSTDTVLVRVNSVAATLQPSVVLCAGDSVRLSVSGGISVRWDPSPDLDCDTCRAPMARPDSTTTYVVTVTGANGCRERLSTTVRVVPLPLSGLPRSIALCSGESATLSASGGVSYQWTPTTGLSCSDCPNPVARPDTTTLYRVRIRSAEGCESVDSIIVTVATSRLQLVDLDTSVIIIDTTELRSTRCRQIVIRNLSMDQKIIDRPWLSRNTEFSIPPSELPLIIPAGGESRLTICYRPTAELLQRDTLTIPDDCPQRLPVQAQGIRFEIRDGIVCDSVAVRVGEIFGGSFLRIGAAHGEIVRGGIAATTWFVGRDDVVRIDLVDLHGERVLSLFDGRASRGEHELRWSAGDLPSGLYFYRIAAGALQAEAKVMVVN